MVGISGDPRLTSVKIVALVCVSSSVVRMLSGWRVMSTLFDSWVGVTFLISFNSSPLGTLSYATFGSRTAANFRSFAFLVCRSIAFIPSVSPWKPSCDSRVWYITFASFTMVVPIIFLPRERMAINV